MSSVAPSLGSSERWEGFIDRLDDETVWLRLYPPDGAEVSAEMPRANFKAPVEPHEVREGLIFFWDISDAGIRWSIPPRYSQEELDAADKWADELSAFFAELPQDGSSQ